MKLRNLLIIAGLLFITNVANAEVLVSHRIVYYDIHGATHQALKQEMVSKGNIRADYISSANTEVTFRSTGTKIRQGSDCKLEQINVMVNATQTYPRWVDMHRGDQTLINEWNKWVNATVAHEDRHLAEGLEAASKLDQHLQSFQWSSDCRTIDDQLKSETNRIMNDYKNNESWKYDRDTNHGMNEGTRW